MKRKIINTILSLGIFTAVAVVPLVGSTASAAPEVVASALTDAQRGVNQVNDGNTKGLQGFIKDIINILLFVIGFVAVLMIIVGGIRYVTSGGDSNSVSSAKNTILYSVIGLVVALMAFAIVNFVLDSLR